MSWQFDFTPEKLAECAKRNKNPTAKGSAYNMYRTAYLGTLGLINYKLPLSTKQPT